MERSLRYELAEQFRKKREDLPFLHTAKVGEEEFQEVQYQRSG